MIINTGYKPRNLQEQIHLDMSRFKVLVCHRRFGKTVYAINDLLDKALRFPRGDGRFAYIAPTYRQAKIIAWDYLKKYAENLPNAKFNISELTLELHNGSTIRLYGADNPDSLRGIYLDEVILDEYGMTSPVLWGEVIRPLLTDRKGGCTFLGTPAGKNHFYDISEYAKDVMNTNWSFYEFKASETGYIDADELKDAKNQMSEDEYLQEFECSFEASVRGSIYGSWIRELKEQGRLTRVMYDPIIPVDTYWDLGVNDSTTIYFVQQCGNEVRFIDYYESAGVGLDHYADVIGKRKYRYGTHYAPHDIRARELGTGKSRQETAASLGITFEILDNHLIADRITNSRRTLPLCWFDEEKCGKALDVLSQYRYDYNEKLRVQSQQPLHDWTSHNADAFGYACWGIKNNSMQGINTVSGNRSNIGFNQIGKTYIGKPTWDVF